MKELTEEARNAIKADLGLTDAEIQEVIDASKTKEATKSEGEPKIALKEKEEAKAEEPDAKAQLAEALATIKSFKAEIETLQTKLKSDVKTALADLLKDAPSGEITRGTAVGKEVTSGEQAKIAAEVAKSSSDSTKSVGGFESFYERFQSKQAV